MNYTKISCFLVLIGCVGLLHAENAYIDRIRLTDSPGEAGAPWVMRITLGKQTFQCLELGKWKWLKDEWGFDAAAVIPDNRTGLVGVRAESIFDSKQQPITKMGPQAFEYLQKRWEAEVVAGNKKIEKWVGDESSFDQTVYFKNTEGNKQYSGIYHYYFEGEQLITLGMIAESMVVTETQTMFNQFNGSFVKIEKK
jgi:hypothetical protein